jgi:hypothetical protein
LVHRDLRWKTTVEWHVRHDALGAEHGRARGATMGSHLGGATATRWGLDETGLPTGRPRGVRFHPGALRGDAMSPHYDFPGILGGEREERMRSGVRCGGVPIGPSPAIVTEPRALIARLLYEEELQSRIRAPEGSARTPRVLISLGIGVAGLVVDWRAHRTFGMAMMIVGAIVSILDCTVWNGEE